LHRACEIAVKLQAEVLEKTGTKKLKDFEVALAESDEIKALAAEVETFSSPFFMPGV
jgi:hypothetical protein